MRTIFFIFFLSTLSINSQVKPFPDCYGAGCETTNDGWRGGTVLHVTSLDDDPTNVVAGTWRYAITRTFPRIIVFDVSGVIELDESIRLNDAHGNVYVAGQTSPNGIIIRGYTHELTSIDEVVIRHVKFYGDPTKTPANDANAGQLGGTLAGFIGGTNIVVDHCDFLYNQNESMNYYADDGNYLGEVTQSYNMFADSGGLGSLIGGDPGNTVGEASSFRNLFAHLSHRTPNAQQGVTAEYINNVTYNTRNRLTNVHSGSQVNFYSNYHKAGPFTAFTPDNDFDRLRRRNLVDWENGQQVWLDPAHWNFMSGVVESGSDTHTDVFIASNRTTLGTNTAANPQPALSTWLRTTEVTMTAGPRPTILTALQAIDTVLSKVGARYYLNADGSVTEVEDSKQTEVITDVVNGTYTNENSGDYTLNQTVPTIVQTSRPVGYDTDSDGMPNTWEIANGLNENVDDSAGNDLDANYTNIEMFLNLVDEPTTSISVAGIVWDNNTQTVEVGGFLDLSYTFSPANASNQGFSLSSSNTGVVSNAGAVIGEGTATLTITADDDTNGTISDVMNVTVNAAPEPGEPSGRISKSRFILIDN